jgi:hypothetical protein
MLEHLFKEFPSFHDRVYDNYAVMLHIVGGVLISITFMIIGILCVAHAGGDPAHSKVRVLMAKLFGLFLIACALSRVADTYAIWHNYAILTGYIKILTGIISGVTIFYIPAVIREIQKIKDYTEVEKKLDTTKEKLDRVQELSDKNNP